MASLADFRASPRAARGAVLRDPEIAAPDRITLAEVGFHCLPVAGLSKRPATGPAPRIHARLAGPAALRPAERHALQAALQAAAFLADIAYRAVPFQTLARMIGRCARAASPAVRRAGGPMTLTLTAGTGETIDVALDRPEPEVEATVFGAAHILHEDETLGLYILEIAPGSSIPAHAHRVMREWELILDDGLLQQGVPVARGAAFAWPLGHAHAYANPTARPLRILCIDSPRFDASDEAPLDPAPPLAPIAPFAEYPV